MDELAYAVRGFLTIRRDSLRAPLRGSLTLRADPGSGLFAGELILDESAVTRKVLGASLVRATVQITADGPVIGHVDGQGRLAATVTVNAVIAAIDARGRTLASGGRLRTATPAVVPLRSQPGFSLKRGGRVAGTYYRPPFTGGGWLTPLVNLLASGAGNSVVIDLIPRARDIP